LEVVEAVIQKNIDLPPQIEAVMDKEKVSIPIAHYNELKTVLLNSIS
jgi:threonine synthase